MGRKKLKRSPGGLNLDVDLPRHQARFSDQRQCPLICISPIGPRKPNFQFLASRESSVLSISVIHNGIMSKPEPWHHTLVSTGWSSCWL